MSADPRSGIDKHGEWSPAFPGQRPPFEPGHAIRATHGAYNHVAITARAEELAGTLRAIVPMYREADEPLIRIVAEQLARLALAYEHLEEGIFEGDSGELRPVLKVLSTWENSAARNLEMLGCAPTARARLGVDVAVARRNESITELHLKAKLERQAAEVVDGEASAEVDA